MIKLDRATTVRRPLPEVVAYFADFGNAEEWDPGTRTCTRIDHGPVEVGARWRNVSEFRGRDTELEYTLDRLEAARVTFVGRNKTVRSVDDISFESDGSVEPPATRISYHAEFTFQGLAKLAQPLVKRSLDRLGDETIEQINQVLGGVPEQRRAR